MRCIPDAVRFRIEIKIKLSYGLNGDIKGLYFRGKINIKYLFIETGNLHLKDRMKLVNVIRFPVKNKSFSI